MDADRTLTPDELAVVHAAAEAAHVRYEGKQVAHRSCGIALAETFGVPTRPYQALRKGGLTGRGECGTAVAGRLLLGELLGDPDPAGGVTDALRAAVGFYERRWDARTGVEGSRRCDALTASFADFRGPRRAARCTSLAKETAALVAETLLRAGHPVTVVPVTETGDGASDG